MWWLGTIIHERSTPRKQSIAGAVLLDVGKHSPSLQEMSPMEQSVNAFTVYCSLETRNVSPGVQLQ